MGGEGKGFLGVKKKKNKNTKKKSAYLSALLDVDAWGIKEGRKRGGGRRKGVF